MQFKEAKPFLKEGMKVRIVRSYFKFNGEELVNKRGVESVVRRIDEEGETHLENDDILYRGDELEILTNPDGSPWVHPERTTLTEANSRDGVRALEKNKVAFYDEANVSSEWESYYNQYWKQIYKPLIMSDWAFGHAPRKKPIMSRLNNMMKRLLDSDTQTLVKGRIYQRRPRIN